MGTAVDERPTEIDVGESGRGRAAAASADWDEAFAAFSAADELSRLDAQDLQVWATAAFLLGHVDVSLDALARAHRLHLEHGDVRSAVRCGFWAGFQLLARGDMAQAAGWLARCTRVAEKLPAKSAEHGYLLIPEAFRLAAVEERWAEAYSVAAQVTDIGRREADADLVALALTLAGRSLIGIGRADDGLSLLDEAMLAVVSGELSPMVSGTVYCSLIEACEEIAEWPRAMEWTEALARWCERQHGMVTFTGQCLTHRAHILRLRGRLEAATEAAQLARERFAGAADERLSGAALYQTGEVHRVRGDVRRAEEAYRLAGEQGHDPQPGLALIRLAQGRVAAAAATLRRAEAEAMRPIHRIRLLPAYVGVMLAAGDLPAASRAAAELASLAGTYRTVALRADADCAQGAVDLAGGDVEAALVSLRRAAEGWRSLGVPYEAAQARLLIAVACRALGDDDTATLELEAAHRTLTELGVPIDDTDGPAASATGRGRHGLSRRELEVLRLVATGMTNVAIADALHVAVKTVDRHVAHILTKLGVPTRTAATAYAYEHDLLHAGNG
jgi:ATP/maltotriose-dependent transcriptional regulator MalT